MSQNGGNDGRFGGPSEDDERDLINSEFESIVSGLSLDQSAPTSYLDELEKFETQEYSGRYEPQLPRNPQSKKMIKWAGWLFLIGFIYSILVFVFQIDFTGYGTLPALGMIIVAVGLLIYANLRPSDHDPYDDGSAV
jgi:hypothetical protein